MNLSDKNLTLNLNEQTGALSVTDGSIGLLFEQFPLRDGYSVGDAKSDNNVLSFTVTRSDGVSANCSAEIVSSTEIRLYINGNGEFSGEFCFPSAIKGNKGDSYLYPICEGLSVPADDLDFPLPARLNMAGGAHLSMGLLGLHKSDDSWVLCANMTTADGVVLNDRVDGFIRSQMAWLPEKGKWGYTREIRYIFGHDGGVGKLGRAYREIAKEKGFVVPFTEKVKKLPETERFLGACDVWLS